MSSLLFFYSIHLKVNSHWCINICPLFSRSLCQFQLSIANVLSEKWRPSKLRREIGLGIYFELSWPSTVLALTNFINWTTMRWPQQLRITFGKIKSRSFGLQNAILWASFNSNPLLSILILPFFFFGFFFVSSQVRKFSDRLDQKVTEGGGHIEEPLR